MNVLIIGAGLMGSQISCEYAIGGHAVSVSSRDAATLRQLPLHGARDPDANPS
jgi:3-hydroxyacyl-CoA dehydrogenase